MYRGPCSKCQDYIERRIRAGKAPLCLECALEKQRDQQRGYADGTHPELARSVEAGLEVREQIRRQEGTIYAHWVGGMARYVSALNTTDDEPGDTIPQ
jgi:hypothetical protein